MKKKTCICRPHEECPDCRKPKRAARPAKTACPNCAKLLELASRIDAIAIKNDEITREASAASAFSWCASQLRAALDGGEA
jgi:hypothetical protein